MKDFKTLKENNVFYFTCIKWEQQQYYPEAQPIYYVLCSGHSKTGRCFFQRLFVYYKKEKKKSHFFSTIF